MALSAKEVGQYAWDAGIREFSALRDFIAIAGAESTFNPKARSEGGKGTSYGLWQINVAAHSLSSLGISKPEDLYDPATNAKAMYKVSNGGKDKGPWKSSDNAYRLSFLPEAAIAAEYIGLKNGGAGGVAAGIVGGAEAAAGAASAAGNALTDISGALTKVSAWGSDRNNWVRVAKVVLGGGLILIGLGITVRGQAMGFLPVGKIGKLAAGLAKGGK